MSKYVSLFIKSDNKFQVAWLMNSEHHYVYTCHHLIVKVQITFIFRNW